MKESDEEHAVRSAYKSLALRFHPDKCTELSSQEATAKFQEVLRAYQASWCCFESRWPVAGGDARREPP